MTCTIPLTTDAGITKTVKNASYSIEINDKGSTNALVADPISTGTTPKRTNGKVKVTAGVVNFGLPNAKSIVGK
jgi:hypothetical protein